MDPSSWANYTQHYSRLRAAGNHQMNQLNQLSGLNVGQTGHQLNVNDHLGIGMSANAGNQTMQSMSSHYGSSAAAHPWLFSSHGLNAGTHQSTNHDTSSFNASPFLHHPSYESTFLSAPFQSKANYLQSAANQFFNPMKKADMSNDMSNLRNAAYCSPMNMPGMGVSGGPPNINNMATDANYGLTTGSIFSSHLTPSSLRHHPNLMATNSSSGPFGILPHEAVNVMNSGTASAHSSHSSHSHSSHASHHTNSSHNKASNDTNKHQHYHHHHKSSSSMSNMARVDNSFPNIIPSLPPPQSSHSISSRNQASFDPTASAKITSHHHHSQIDPYTSFSMAAVHAMNTDYASMQQNRYASSMPTSNQHTAPFTAGNTSRASYPSVGFPSEPRSRDLLSTSSLLQSSKQGSNNSCNSRNMSAMNASYLSANCGMMNAMSMNASAVNNYSPSPAHNVNNAVTNNLTVNSSASRSSSSASNHALQQGNDSSSCSYGYGSPATNLPQSPFQQQPQRSNSSQGTPNASAAAQPSAQDYTNYGTSQGFPSLGTQTPTPTPGYPTPPSSVGQSLVSQTPNTQQTSHDEQVSHYPQLTPQTSSSQSASFSANYNTNFTNTKLNPNSSRTPESIIPNSSSCMVAAAAAVASLNNPQNNAVVTQRTPPAYLISGTNLHESDAESCLSNIVNVNSLSDSISDAKLANSQMNSSNDVIGHQSEPTLNSVFSSQDIDFPSISFPVSDETTNNYNNSVKLEQSSYSKKKSKNGKKNKKKDKNKGIGISVDPNNAFPGYHYSHAPQPQYQNSYPAIPNAVTNSYMMPTNIHQQSQQTHNVLGNNTNGESEQNTDTCYDMQYQHHNHALTQQVQQQQQEAVVSQPSSHPQEHELLQQIPHDTLQQSVQQPVQPQHQIMESVMSVQTQSQPQTQPQTASVAEKQQTFPTIDDELSFLTEPPNDCVSMETQTPDVQLDPQSNVDAPNPANLCSERSELSPLTNNSNSNHGNSSSQTSGFLKSYMSFISDSSRMSPSTPSTTKEKKKRKHKELNENKVKSSANNLCNGQKSKNNKKSKTDIISDDNNSEFPDFIEQRKKNNYLMNEITPKLMSGENIANKPKTGDNRENYESKFFKRRPSNNVNSNNNTNNTIHVNNAEVNNSRSDAKITKKRKQNKINTNSMAFNAMQSMHDEYEFPDSPLASNTLSAKKQRKSSSSENSSKKQKQMPTFEKITAPSININFKKTNKKPSVTAPLPVVTPQTKSQTKCSVATNNAVNTNNNIKGELTKEANNVTNCNLNVPTISEKVQSFHQQQANKIQDILKQQTQTQTQPTQPFNNHISQLNNSQKLNNVPNKKQTLSQPLANKKNSATKANTLSVTTPQPTVSTQQTPVTSTLTANVTSNNISSNNVANNLMSVNCNSTQSIGMQSAGTNTPRRRSQDKKASTIREGLMRTGDFVVSMEESQFELPVIWRIEGKSLLQRFEPQDQDGNTVYINTSSYSAWNPTVRQRYTGVDVRIMGCSRTRIVVEKLGLTQNNPNAVNGSATIERVSGYNRSSSSSSNSSTFQHQENFEVFIQTLISQALDPNFISEIVKENDEYFLSHVQAIDDFCSRKKSRFFSKVKWEANIVKLVETYPLFTVTPQDNSGDLRCRLCHDNWSTQLIQFDGEPYHQMTLDAQTITDIKQTKPAACDSCTDKIVLYSSLHHQKYNFFLKCKAKVEDMRGGDENKESHVILEQCLQDNEWINSLFKQLEEIWLSCDKIR